MDSERLEDVKPPEAMVTYLNLDSSVASARPLFAMRAAILIRPHAADRRYINLPTRSKHAHCCGTTRVGLTEQAPAMTATANSMYPHEPEAKELIAELCKLFYDQVLIITNGLTIDLLRRCLERGRHQSYAVCRDGCQALEAVFPSAVERIDSQWHLLVFRRSA